MSLMGLKREDFEYCVEIQRNAQEVVCFAGSNKTLRFSYSLQNHQIQIKGLTGFLLDQV
jgi:hypothetical protein